MNNLIKIKSRIDVINLELIIPDNWNKEKLIVLIHGFNSSPEGKTYHAIANFLKEQNIASAIFALPYHKERREGSKPEDFTIDNCIEDIDLVEAEIKKMYPNVKLGVIGTSFGGYLTLLRLKKEKLDYYTIILKSPAIKMGEIVKNSFPKEAFKEFKERGFGIVGDRTPMKVLYNFYKDLTKNKVSDLGVYLEKIYIFHGSKDDTVPVKDSKEFENLNPNVELTVLDGENHSYTEEGLRKFCDGILNEV